MASLVKKGHDSLVFDGPSNRVRRLEEIPELQKRVLLGGFGKWGAREGDETRAFERQSHLGMMRVVVGAVGLVHKNKRIAGGLPQAAIGCRSGEFVNQGRHDVGFLVNQEGDQVFAGAGLFRVQTARAERALDLVIEVTSAVAAAHEEGARTTAHCFGEASLADFAAAGTDCIEHATGLLPDTIESFAAQQIAIVPTLVNIATFPRIAAPAAEKFPRYHDHMLALHARRYETIGAAYEAGVPVFVGTDAGGALAHGLVAQECVELARAGMPVGAVLAAATWGAREWLRRPGLEEGADADLLVLPADPRSDLGVLGAPTAIVLRGVRY